MNRNKFVTGSQAWIAIKYKNLKHKILKYNYLLTSWSRVLPEKLPCLQLVKKFPTFYGTQRFITAFTSVRHCPYPEPTQSSPYPHIPLPEDPSLYYHPIYSWVSPVVSLPQVSPPKPCTCLSPPPMHYLPHLSQSS